MTATPTADEPLGPSPDATRTDRVPDAPRPPVGSAAGATGGPAQAGAGGPARTGKGGSVPAGTGRRRRAARPPNPFAVPGLRRDVDPLNPLRHRDHVHFYVPVDHTEESFEQCQEEFGDPSYLHHEGRLVLVTGERGCGKTALINRCAHWLREQLGKADLTAEVVDLTREARDNEAIPQRRGNVCRALMDKLFELQLLTTNLAYEMRDSPDDAYRNLPGCLERDQVLIVLLPPSADLTEELVYYGIRAPRRVVFFAETAYALPAEHRQALDRDSPVPPVYLHVSGFDHRHADQFAQHRLDRLPAGTLPRLAPTALEDFIDNGRLATIREMQWLLYGLYEELRVQDDRPDEVTWEHISRHFIRRLRDLEGQP
ncbi:hypothetical protein [Micromonospora sp. NBC_01412]|uniref:hypothetical protein n=1 Tax=Micromonospora sp. NBC_01412 TaxID=2903590 RepID=UPI00325363C6